MLANLKYIKVLMTMHCEQFYLLKSFFYNFLVLKVYEGSLTKRACSKDTCFKKEF